MFHHLALPRGSGGRWAKARLSERPDPRPPPSALEECGSVWPEQPLVSATP